MEGHHDSEPEADDAATEVRESIGRYASAVSNPIHARACSALPCRRPLPEQ